MTLNNPPIPLTTATLPVASVGMGLGEDYAIYIVSRIIEEYRDNKRELMIRLRLLWEPQGRQWCILV